MIDIRPMADDETGIWTALRSELWPDCGPAENEADVAAYRAGGSVKCVFLAFDAQTAVGFAEISERSVVDGCGRNPAAYVEGWYVAPTYRGQGVGGRLIAETASWARKNGYDYLGSDVEPDNLVSQKAHRARGFVETGRAVNFHMRLA